MRNEIVMIGPMGVGKSHMSKILSERLGKKHIKVDQIRFDYYNEIGYDREKEQQIGNEKGFFEGIYRYWKPFELYAIKKILNDFSDCVFDFGAGHSVYEDDTMFSGAKEALSDFKNVIFLLPCSDIEESVDFLAKRNGMSENDEEGKKILRHFISHHSNYDLSTYKIYIKDKTEDEIYKEILALTFEDEVLKEKITLTEQLKNNSENAELLFKLALNHLKLCEYELSYEYGVKSAELDPSNHDCILICAKNSVRLEKWEKAIEYLNKVIEYNPTEPEYLYMRGQAYHKLGMIENAKSDYKQSLEMNLNNIHYARAVARNSNCMEIRLGLGFERNDLSDKFINEILLSEISEIKAYAKNKFNIDTPNVSVVYCETNEPYEVNISSEGVRLWYGLYKDDSLLSDDSEEIKRMILMILRAVLTDD